MLGFSDIDSGKALRVDCTLFWHNNGKSVHLLHDALLDIFEYMDWKEVEHLNTELLDVTFAANDVGKTARSVLNECSITQVMI